MLKIVQRYIFDKKLEPLADDTLVATVRSYDQLLTWAGVPTARLDDVYAEAMKTHGPYLLKVDDYIRAWGRIRPDEGRGVDTRPMGERGSGKEGCSICGGTGRTTIFIPSSLDNPIEGVEVEKECPYHCDVVTAIERKS